MAISRTASHGVVTVGGDLFSWFAMADYLQCPVWITARWVDSFPATEVLSVYWQDARLVIEVPVIVDENICIKNGYQQWLGQQQESLDWQQFVEQAKHLHSNRHYAIYSWIRRIVGEVAFTLEKFVPCWVPIPGEQTPVLGKSAFLGQRLVDCSKALVVTVYPSNKQYEALLARCEKLASIHAVSVAVRIVGAEETDSLILGS